MMYNFFCPHGTTALNGPGYPHCLGFTVALGRTPLGEESARCRDLYPTSTQHSQVRDPYPGRIRTRSPSKRTAAGLDPLATGIGMIYCINLYATWLYNSNNNNKSWYLLHGICIILKMIHCRIGSMSVQYKWFWWYVSCWSLVWVLFWP